MSGTGTPPWTATAQEYQIAIRGLLRPGPADRRPLDSRTGLYLLGIAREMVRLHTFLVSLQAEMDPARTTLALEAWESALGLPEVGEVLGGSTAQRRLDALAKFTAKAVITEAEWVAFAEAAGYTGATVRAGSAEAFTCNSDCNDPVTGEEWTAYVWYLVLPGVSNAAFEAMALKMKPSHTRLIFEYV